MTATKKRFFERYLLALVAMTMALSPVLGQEKEKFVTADSLTTTTITVDSSKNGKKQKVRVYNPKVATLRSALLPGLGQIYNKKYWKLPIVYGALGISGGVFLYNLKNYKDTRFAYRAKYNASLPGATAADTAELLKIKPKLQRIPMDYLKVYRDEFRRDIDYSVLVFLLLWGLNVVDATVDAHLKAFDVSPDLSLKIKPGHSQMAGTNGISLVLAFR
ncbi:MAG: DUF5683 domain-containing protein [Bacteroidota bacterium]|nr:DUF5683 domain-containing protein [Bacteroidota bacterium]